MAAVVRGEHEVILRDLLGPWGLQMSFVRMTDLADVRQTLRDMVGAAVIARTDDEFLQRILTVQRSGGEVPALWLLADSARGACAPLAHACPQCIRQSPATFDLLTPLDTWPKAN